MQEYEEFEELVEADELHRNHLLELFDTMSLREKFRRVISGLKEPHDTGEYKWARLQTQRLMAPASAVVVPTLACVLLVLFAAFKADDSKSHIVEIAPEPEEEKLEDIEKHEIEKLEFEPEPIDVNFSDLDVNVKMPDPTPVPDFSPQPAPIDSVAIVKSPIVMKGIYGSRAPGARGRAMGRYGGSRAGEDCVLRALRWLKKNQNSEGSCPNHKAAMTGLALLTFLAHGETPASPEFGDTVERAIRYLIESQDAAGGWPRRYEHPIATYALCEAYGLTRVPMVKEAAAKGVDILIAGQNPAGGWRYTMTPNDESDSTVMSWCVQAIKAAKMAGLENDGLDDCLKRAILGFKGNYSDGGDKGGFGYTGPGMSGLTGAGVLCLQLLGVPNAPEVRKGQVFLDATTFNWEGGGVNNKNYYWYYITQAKFHDGGERWARWNNLFAPTLIKHQTIVAKDKSGYVDHKGQPQDIGHWDMNGEISGHTDGVVMNTALCTLQLEVYYRYLPTFHKPEDLGIAEVAAEEDDGDIEIEVNM